MAPKKRGRGALSKKVKIGESSKSQGSGKDFARAVKVERSCNLEELKDNNMHYLVHKLQWELLCNQTGHANITLVRQFYSGIIPESIDEVNCYLEAKVRGVKVHFSTDTIASHYGLDRSTTGEYDFPYVDEWGGPSEAAVAQTLYQPALVGGQRWFVRNLKPELSVLCIFLKHNVDPRGTRNSFSPSFARLMYETIHARKIDVGRVIWMVARDVYMSDGAYSALPFGMLITSMCKVNRVKTKATDEFGRQMQPIVRASLGRSTGQTSSKMPTTPQVQGATLDLVVRQNSELMTLMQEQYRMQRFMLLQMTKLSQAIASSIARGRYGGEAAVTNHEAAHEEEERVDMEAEEEDDSSENE